MKPHSFSNRPFAICYLCLLLAATGCSYLPAPVTTDDGVEVILDPEYTVLEPENAVPSTTTFVFYPGGLVDPAAYQTMLDGIAENGYRVVVPRMPANLAVFDVDAAKQIEERFASSQHWIIGGHSLGAAMACTHLNVNRTKYNGLVLMAGYPAQNQSLADWPGAVLSLSAEFDGLATAADIDVGKPLLPEPEVVTEINDFPQGSTLENTLYYEIPGGNHAGFGDYGEQASDGQATITVQEQHQEIEAFVLAFFTSNNW